MSLKQVTGLHIDHGSPLETKHSTLRNFMVHKDIVKMKLKEVIGSGNVARKIMHQKRNIE